MCLSICLSIYCISIFIYIQVNYLSTIKVIDTATKLYLVLELGDGGDMYDYIMKELYHS